MLRNSPTDDDDDDDGVVVGRRTATARPVPFDVDGDGVVEAIVVPAPNATSDPDGSWRLRVLDLTPAHDRRGGAAEATAFPFYPFALFESEPVRTLDGDGAAAPPVPLKMASAQMLLRGGGGAPGRRRWKSTGRPEKTSWIQKTRRGTTSAAHPGRTRLKGAERPVRGGLAPPPAPAGRAATPTPPATRRRRQRMPRPTKGRRSETSSRRRRMVSRASPQFGLTGASRCTVLREATIPKEREGIQIRGHLRRRR